MAEKYNCDRVVSLLRSYYDNRLGYGETRKVENHIAGCSDCMCRFESYRDVGREVDDRRKPIPPLRRFGGRDLSIAEKLFNE